MSAPFYYSVDNTSVSSIYYAFEYFADRSGIKIIQKTKN